MIKALEFAISFLYTLLTSNKKTLIPFVNKYDHFQFWLTLFIQFFNQFRLSLNRPPKKTEKNNYNLRPIFRTFLVIFVKIFTRDKLTKKKFHCRFTIQYGKSNVILNITYPRIMTILIMVFLNIEEKKIK